MLKSKFHSPAALLTLSLTALTAPIIYAGTSTQQEKPAVPDITDILRAPPQSPTTEPAPEETDIIDELDALSRTDNQNPFGDDIEISKTRKPVSVTLRALDKIIARTIDIEVSMNTLANFGDLEIVPRFCDKRPPEDFPETSAFLEIFDKRATSITNRRQQDETLGEGEADKTQTQRTQATPASSSPSGPAYLSEPSIGPKTSGEKVFSGWMFASSPGLNALEHGVYDVWVIDCKTQLVDTSIDPASQE